jgi:shikimate kinase
MKNNIILIGFMGTGKTTVGRLLAESIGCGFVDTDDLIKERAGLAIPEIFNRFGEEYFRRLEREIIHQVVTKDGMVIATGGGAVMDPKSFALMKQRGYVIALDASEQTLRQRLQSCRDRPMLMSEDPAKTIKQLLVLRRPLYYQAHYVVTVDGKTPSQIVDEIMQIFNTI